VNREELEYLLVNGVLHGQYPGYLIKFCGDGGIEEKRGQVEGLERSAKRELPREPKKKKTKHSREHEGR